MPTKPVVFGPYVRENVLNPPVPAKLTLNNSIEDVLVLKYVFKEGTVFNEVQRLDNNVLLVPNKWITFPVEEGADVKEDI